MLIKDPAEQQPQDQGQTLQNQISAGQHLRNRSYSSATAAERSRNPAEISGGFDLQTARLNKSATAARDLRQSWPMGGGLPPPSAATGGVLPS